MPFWLSALSLPFLVRHIMFSLSYRIGNFSSLTLSLFPENIRSTRSTDLWQIAPLQATRIEGHQAYDQGAEVRGA